MNIAPKISEVTRVLPEQNKALEKLGLKSAEDLLYRFPVRYGDTTQATTIEKLQVASTGTIFGRVKKSETKKSFRSKVPMAEVVVEDDTASIKLVFFSQAYIAKLYPEGSLVRVEGEVKKGKAGLSMVNPHIESVAKIPEGIGDSLFGDEGAPHSLYPIYRESKGITSNWIYHTLQRVFVSDYFHNLEEYMPEELLEKLHLPTLKTALVWIHTPVKRADAEAARKRFSFEEIFLIQLKKQKERELVSREKPFVVSVAEKTIQEFTSRFKFELTDGQKQAISEILTNFASGHPMSRLLHGDVGSGKTAVAATTAYAIVKTRPQTIKDGEKVTQNFGALQVAYMAPTEILAKQHFESFIKFFSHLPINIGLLTGSGCMKFPSKVSPTEATEISRNQLLKWVENGEIPILIGTHALIQKSVSWKHLAFVVIDEQHRFGTKQREKLVRKNRESFIMPHLLSMTATPIPRTLALTIYGDLDLSLMKDLPAGRKEVRTEIVKSTERKRVYEEIRARLKAGRQAYVICPRIAEDEDSKLVSAESEAKRLRKEIFPEYKIDILHSKMTTKKKDEVMERFERGETDILVSTSVVEVGVNVPNATSILIEGADRFGLSQLHQLRGRVLRSSHEAYCYLATDSDSEKSIKRLTAIEKTRNGFELAEQDLALRGAGVLYGEKQWGLTDLGMEALTNLKLVTTARSEAEKLIKNDLELLSYPKLQRKVEEMPELHFE